MPARGSVAVVLPRAVAIGALFVELVVDIGAVPPVVAIGALALVVAVLERLAARLLLLLRSLVVRAEALALLILLLMPRAALI